MRIYTKRWNDPYFLSASWRILVSRYRPRALLKQNETWDIWFSELGPSPKLHADAYGKNRKLPITRDEYKRRYLREMQSKMARDLVTCLGKLVSEGYSITLLCSSACIDESACHRTLLKELIRQAADQMNIKSA